MRKNSLVSDFNLHQLPSPSVCLSVCLSVCPSVILSVCLSLCLSLSSSTCLSLCLFVSCQPSVCLSLCPSVHLSCLASCLLSYSPLVKAKEGPNDMLKVKLCGNLFDFRFKLLCCEGNGSISRHEKREISFLLLKPSQDLIVRTLIVL